MTSLTAAEARTHFSEIINKVAYGKDRVLLTRHGKGLAAVISMQDLDVLKKLEDSSDLREAGKELLKAKNEKTVPWDKLKPSAGKKGK